MIPLGVHHFGKRTVWSLIFFLIYAYYNIQPSRKFLVTTLYFLYSLQYKHFLFIKPTKKCNASLVLLFVPNETDQPGSVDPEAISSIMAKVEMAKCNTLSRCCFRMETRVSIKFLTHLFYL